MVQRAGVDLDPIVHLLDSLHRAAALVEVWGAMVAALDAAAETEAEANDTLRGELHHEVAAVHSGAELAVTTNERLLSFNCRGEAQIHPFVAEYQSALDRRAKFAKLCVDAGIADRQVRIAEEQGALLARAIRGILDELGVADKPNAGRIIRKHLELISGTPA